ncbi:hypothetical protein BKP37_17010 [Anaerobacillus alkalilacustris]|uniref:Uncharacterized protein n=1 Tax=Anaerobacillus alkalilacustris TaxID=393763 RepID=A0A1S2LF09_9BACI|nr:hypothetical protein [Anaerobacillus alkalilacustris]OIJ11109.1 hypothetical protein BKP37_17010 [Anaerobacillus alkalilacustris]
MRTKVLKLLKIVSNSLTHLSDSEIEKLLSGEGKLIFSDKKITKSKVMINDDVQKHPVVAKLRYMDSREEATTILSARDILKKDLITIASTLNVHINKSDNKAKIIEKIVEATVGAQLRSKAIMETSVKR